MSSPSTFPIMARLPGVPSPLCYVLLPWLSGAPTRGRGAAHSRLCSLRTLTCAFNPHRKHCVGWFANFMYLERRKSEHERNMKNIRVELSKSSIVAENGGGTDRGQGRPNNSYWVCTNPICHVYNNSCMSQKTALTGLYLNLRTRHAQWKGVLRWSFTSAVGRILV